MWVVQIRKLTGWQTIAYGLSSAEALLLQNKLVLAGSKVRSFKQEEDEIVA